LATEVYKMDKLVNVHKNKTEHTHTHTHIHTHARTRAHTHARARARARYILYVSAFLLYFLKISLPLCISYYYWI